MVERIQQNQRLAITGVESDPPRLREIGIARLVLAADRTGLAQILWPPGRTRDGLRPLEELAICHGVRQLYAQIADGRLQAVVEHVADHGHATGHPLTVAAQLLNVELRHRSAAGRNRPGHLFDRLLRQSVAASDLGNCLAAALREIGHRVYFLETYSVTDSPRPLLDPRQHRKCDKRPAASAYQIGNRGRLGKG